MNIYLALLVPLVITFGFYLYKKHEFAWWEFFIPIASTLVMIVISKLIIDYSSVHFNEYWGSTVTAVYEEEPWNEWHHETCSYTTTDSKGNTTTHYYDCSHQDDYAPEWYAVTNLNEKFSITEKMHDELVAQFKTKKTVIDSRRNHSARSKAVGSNGTKFEGKRVGETSYIFQTVWSGDDNTRKAYVSVHSYVNKIKATDLSIFNIKEVTDEQANSLGLFKYPDYNGGGFFTMTGGLEYPTILGGNVSKATQEKFKRLNGKFGVSNELRLWILVFNNKPMSITQLQQNYWVKGNMNELVICIGKKGNEIIWADAFSWSLSADLTADVKNKVLDLYTYKDSVVKRTMPKVVPVTKDLQKKVLGKAGEKIPQNMLPVPNNQANADTIIKVKSPYPVLNEQTWNEYYNYLNDNLKRFKRRSFKEFDYLSVEPSTAAIIIVFVLAALISVGVNLWVISNEFYDDNDGGDKKWKRRNSYY